MKKILFAVLALFLIGTTVTYAQKTTDEIRKEMNKKASKDARKEAKRLKKEGWEVAPGALPIDKQLDRAYMMQYDISDSGLPKYVMGEAMSVGEHYDAAKMQALQLAKQNLAGGIQTEVSALVEGLVSNKQLTAGEAASLSETTMSSKALITQNLGRIITVAEMYRTAENGNKEVLVRIAYNSELAIEAAKNAIRQNMKAKGDDLSGKLDAILERMVRDSMSN